GPELMKQMRKQAEKFGAKIISKKVTAVDFKNQPLKVIVGDETFETEAVIVSTGARAMRLGLPGEEKLYGKGISACATCDGYFFRDKVVVVVGGGDAAMEEATFLTKFASRVIVVHRREALRASQPMQERAKNNPKIEFVFNSEVIEIFGINEGKLSGVKIKNLVTNETKDLEAEGMFVAIGHAPATEIFKGQLELDQKGYVVTKSKTTETSVKGVFAAGDVADYRYRQAITAAGSGCAAAIDVERFLEHKHES
ncbi:MAG: FAD-dependent oxidoreductase, partial [bacterium]|nr:FAD-dependent oxidoreductase [bacterium]